MDRPPHVTIIFCEDVRQELNNKQSYLGVLGPTLNFGELPTRLEKLTAVVILEVYSAEPLSVSLSVDFDWKDAPHGVEQQTIDVEKPDGGENRYNANFLLQFAGLVIANPGRMVVHVEAGGVVCESALEFRVMEDLVVEGPTQMKFKARQSGD